MEDFRAGIDFFNRVAELAEAEDHHPDLHLESYLPRPNRTFHAMPSAACRRTTSFSPPRSTNCPSACGKLNSSRFA